MKTLKPTTILKLYRTWARARRRTWDEFVASLSPQQRACLRRYHRIARLTRELERLARMAESNKVIVLRGVPEPPRPRRK